MPLPDETFKNELDRDIHYKNKAKEYILQNPVQYLKLSINRVIITYSRETIGVAWNQPSLERKMGVLGVNSLKIFSSIYWLIFFAISLMAILILLYKQKLPIHSPLLIIPTVFFIIPILTVGQDRYHMALIPFIAIFSAAIFTRTPEADLKTR